MKTYVGVMQASLSRAVDAIDTRDVADHRGNAIAVPTVRQVWLLAIKQFSDRFRSGWVVASMAVWLVAICLTSFFGLLQIGHIGAQGYERTVVSLLNLAQYLVPLLALLLGHDLIVSEREERTIRLLLAAGLSRNRFLLGKFFGECLTLSLPLLVGFSISGVSIGIATGDSSFAPFVRLAASGIALGIIFLGLGMMISALSRTRVQALVVAILTWCFFIFVFDLVALGITLSSKAPAAANEIELVCDAMHVNAAADIHSDFEETKSPASGLSISTNVKSTGFSFLAANPVDVFRLVNLPIQLGIRIPPVQIGGCFIIWLVATLGISSLKLRRTDL